MSFRDHTDYLDYVVLSKLAPLPPPPPREAKQTARLLCEMWGLSRKMYENPQQKRQPVVLLHRKELCAMQVF